MIPCGCRGIQGGGGRPMNPEYLSQLLRQGDLGAGVLAAGMAAAFALGAVHALSPGHGKTIVAAYLAGASGKVRHAVLLGAVTTFTHTAGVFALGLATLLLSRHVLPDRIVPVLSLISGAAIVWIGAALLWRRVRALRHGHHHHHHHHKHAEVSLGALIALGASGGLAPCPSALVLMLSSMALGRVPLGLLLLAAFSAGLAAVLTGIGILALYARRLLPESKDGKPHSWTRLAPVVSAAVIVIVGLLMTAAAAGTVRAL